ncbi:tryptophan 7-halogenase [Parasphingorhabdus litoris]|uniref:Tryptophan 7-halogenase n=1 Tax=Parasphingorhabdus litoris TaxID=394733 RepID=A0ABN1AD48_9SPHN|nr:tryptophan halogenase family protein [Parasphingorhabdus litoris]
MTDPAAKDFVILGGGTAGWMAACLLAHQWRDRGAKVTLIESKEIGIIGVGEGSTPQLKAFFDRLGIAECKWMPACDATYKNGISFHGWSNRSGYESYFHPFPAPIDSHTAAKFFYNTRARRTGRDVDAHPDRFFLPALLAATDKAPKAPEHFPFEPSYGYHFDAHKVGAFLAGHATENLGVRHIEGRVEKVERADNGDIAALVTEDGARIAGDFFLDCSGFRAILFNGALEEPFLAFSDNLFNDSAVVMPTAHADDAGLPSQTKATALSAGWIWDIPLTTRSGNGYVYSSSHIDAETAEQELRQHLGVGDQGEARHLKMRVGRVRNSWSHNALAIGLSQGFLEPLEATALHIVMATVEQFIGSFEVGGYTPENRDSFNADIAARYEGIRDYIVCHYKVNRREDAAGIDYWAACRNNHSLSDDLKAVLTNWYIGGDLAAEIARLDISKYYSAISWHSLLAGYGTFPDDAKITPPGEDIVHHDMDDIGRFLERCALNFSDHAAAL